jgi:2-methylisocitrate lyase-like PEP mutase family enzyme
VRPGDSVTTATEKGQTVRDRSVDCRVNVVMGPRGAQLTVSELSALGVARVSVGSALYRAALGAFLAGAEEIRDHGSFTFASASVAPAAVDAVFAADEPDPQRSQHRRGAEMP